MTKTPFSYVPCYSDNNLIFYSEKLRFTKSFLNNLNSTKPNYFSCSFRIMSILTIQCYLLNLFIYLIKEKITISRKYPSLAKNTALFLNYLFYWLFSNFFEFPILIHFLRKESIYLMCSWIQFYILGLQK